MSANHDIDFPTSTSVGGYYDDNTPPLNDESARKGFIKRVCITRSSRISPTKFEVGFYIDWTGDEYDKAEAYRKAIAVAQGVLLLDDTIVIDAKPFRKANESLAHFWIRFTLAKGK